MTSAWFTEDGTVVTAQIPSGLEQSLGNSLGHQSFFVAYTYIYFFLFFFLMLKTRAHDLGFMCLETWASCAWRLFAWPAQN